MDEEREAFEQKNVHNVYEKIAKDFSKTRYNVWESVKAFLDQIPDDNGKMRKRVLEVGSGNGKNLFYLKNVSKKVGCDMSENFVQMVREKGIHCIKANAMDLPFHKNTYDYTLCVAVIHHLSDEERRIKAIKELIRVTTTGGLIYIHVWALEQNLNDGEGRKEDFATQDVMVPWNNQEGCDRAYHVFVEGELERLVLEADPCITIVNSGYDRGNWTITLEKTKP